MIEITANNDGLCVDERCVFPTVYLDHWAWMKISESEILSRRFLTALKSCGGTLAFSWLNIIEFSKVIDPRQPCKADALLNEIWPNVFILYPNFFKVIEHEDVMFAGASQTAPPHADFVLLKAIIKLGLLKRDSLKILSTSDLFRLVVATRITHDDFADSVVKHIESLRQAYRDNREISLAVNRLPQGRPIQRGTRFIARELLGSFLKDQKIPASRNHAMDLCHAVVTVAYCDYVLLDSHWADQVERARKRIHEGCLSFPIARVFSGKANGIEKFLNELESCGNLPSASNKVIIPT